MGIVVTVLAAPVVWVAAGIGLFVLVYLVTAVLSLTYRLLATDPSPANDPAVALATIFPILIGVMTFAPFLIVGSAAAKLRDLVRHRTM